jgi:membrane protein DedA with SNARE-associated domain
VSDAVPSPAATRSKWHLPLLLVPVACVVTAGYVANALAPTLVNEHPLWLIALSPINRYLLATTNYLTATEYFGVGFVRHVLPDPFYWLLGYWYGDRALRWAVETYPMLRSVAGEDGRALEQPGTRKILYPLAFLAPNTWVSLLCGAARLPFATFALLNATGTLARLVLFRWLGRVFDDEIETVIDFIARYQMPATIISIVVVLVGAALQFRKGKGELFGLTTLDDIEDDEPV